MTHHDIFDSLTRNAFDFLERGITEFDKSPKYSVIHFCAAVEMLLKARLIDHFNPKHEIFTMARRAGGDCNFLDKNTRRCTVYEKRPETCRLHPKKGPKPGFCAYGNKALSQI